MDDTTKLSRRDFGKLAAGMGILAMAGAVMPETASAQNQSKPEFKNIRRRERALSEADAWGILNKGLYGVLATVDKNAQPHGTPISYSIDSKNGNIYFHGAKTGQKVDNMKQNSRVCFTVVTEDEPIFIADPFDYSAYFASTMAYGKAEILDGAEKKKALLTIVAKYFPENIKGSDEYYDKYHSRIDVWRISVDRITGKAHERGTKIEVPE